MKRARVLYFQFGVIGVFLARLPSVVEESVFMFVSTNRNEVLSYQFLKVEKP